GATLVIRSLSELGRVPLGFDPDRVLVFRITAGWGETNNMKAVARRMERTLETLGAVPGVEAAALSIGLPGTGEPYTSPLEIIGRKSTPLGEQVFADNNSVSPEYFRLLRIPLLAGETCRSDPDATGPRP